MRGTTATCFDTVGSGNDFVGESGTDASGGGVGVRGPSARTIAGGIARAGTASGGVTVGISVVSARPRSLACSKDAGARSGIGASLVDRCRAGTRRLSKYSFERVVSVE